MKRVAELKNWLPSLCVAALAAALLLSLVAPLNTQRSLLAAAPDEQATEGKQLDPAAWGADHVDQPLPAYTEGGECLFCHRHQVGVTWQTNKHNRTIRDAEPTEPAVTALRDNDSTKAIAPEVTL